MPVVIDPLAGHYRALRTVQCPQHILPNATRTGYRVSSAAFKMQSDGTISVDLEEALLRDDLALTAHYPGVDRAVALVAHTVEVHQSYDAAVTHVPVPGNDQHGEVRSNVGRKPMERAARALADTCQEIVPIDAPAAVALGAIPL